MKTKTNNGDREAAAIEVACAPSGPGVPLARRPWALRPPAPFAAALSFLARPQVRVWAAPALRGATLALGLGAVAALGHAADLSGRAGIRLSAEALSAPVVLRSPSTNALLAVAPPAAALGASTSSPASPSSASPSPVSASKPSGSAPAVAPAAGGASTPLPCTPALAGAARPSALTADGRVILNEATIEDFMRLPGVGQKRAEAMLALREKMGGFKRISDLMRVKGIGYKSLKKFESLAVVSRPPEEMPAGKPGAEAAAAPGIAPPRAQTGPRAP